MFIICSGRSGGHAEEKLQAIEWTDPRAIDWEQILVGGQRNAEMCGPPDRLGKFLSGMSWIGKVETKSGLIARERKAGRQAAKIAGSQAVLIKAHVDCGMRIWGAASGFVFQSANRIPQSAFFLRSSVSNYPPDRRSVSRITVA